MPIHARHSTIDGARFHLQIRFTRGPFKRIDSYDFGVRPALGHQLTIQSIINIIVCLYRNGDVTI